MAESSILWDTNGTGDGTLTGYTEAQMAQWMQLLAQGADKSGVAPDRDNELAVSGTATPVSVATGSAIVHGTPYFNTGVVTVAIPTPTVSTRVDRIVLRKSWSAQTVRITRIAGTEGAGIPSVSQSDGTTWDLPLAQVSITTGGVITVTDERAWLSVVGDEDITTAKIADANVTTAKIADSNVTTAKIADSNVTTAKIADANVTTAKIADLNVTTGKLADDAVTAAKIATGAVGTTEIDASAVTTAKIADLNVTTAKIADNGVTQAKLGTDTLRMMIIPLPAGRLANNNAVAITNTSYAGGDFWGFAIFDADKLPAGATVKLAVYGIDSTNSLLAQLYHSAVGAFSITAITGAEVTLNVSQGTAITADFATNLPSGEKAYYLLVKASAGTVYLGGAHLLVEW